MRNNKIITIAKILIGIMALSLVFCIGAHFGQTTSELQTTINTNPNITTSISPHVECRVCRAHQKCTRRATRL